MLFVILYRMRLLLLYGVWVTVLYGAFRAVVDLTTAAGNAGYQMINRAANMLYGPADGSSSGSAGESAPDAAVSQRVAAAAAECSEEAGADGGNHTGASAGSGGSSSSSFPAKNRPTATVFEDMMSAVIPVYLMLLGSVVFFASI
jgi:hypothetical protein